MCAGQPAYRALQPGIVAFTEVLHDPSGPINQHLRRPVMVLPSPPGGVVVILGDRVGDAEPLDRGFYAFPLVLEAKRRGVDPNDHKALVAVGLVSLVQVWACPLPIYAGMRPKVDEHNFAA
jgi:hypothetical protein